MEVPPRTATLTLRLRFHPAQVNRIRNLVTLSLFDPHRFRGAGHRHDPDQEVTVSLEEATPGFLPGRLSTGLWTVELDLHAVLETARGDGLAFELEVEAEPAPATDPDIDEEVPEAEPIEVGVPESTSPPPSRLDRTSSAPHSAVRSSHAASLPRGEGSSGGTARPSGSESHKRWLKGDLHVHSNHSDGRWMIDDVVEYVRRHALDFIALTDHNTTSGREHLIRALEAAGLDTVVIPAMELTTYWGHANALGVSEWIDWRVRGPEGQPQRIGESSDAPPSGTFADAAKRVRERGGLFVINHPRSAGYPVCTGCRWEMGDASAGYASAIEVMNGPWAREQNDAALKLWDRWLSAGHRLPATAGSDAHGFPRRPEEVGFTYALATADVHSILDAVRTGQTYLSRGPAVEWLPSSGDGAPPGVRLSGLDGSADVCLVADGRRLPRTKVDRDGDVQLPLDGPARWVRAEVYVRNKQELLALTNPVWLQ